eukprot:3172513-Rhodomonas_salina.2
MVNSAIRLRASHVMPTQCATSPVLTQHTCYSRYHWTAPMSHRDLCPVCRTSQLEGDADLDDDPNNPHHHHHHHHHPQHQQNNGAESSVRSPLVPERGSGRMLGDVAAVLATCYALSQYPALRERLALLLAGRAADMPGQTRSFLCRVEGLGSGSRV